MRKIVLIGPESTGKTTMSEMLAKHFKEPWVPEYAREFLNKLNRPYNQEDLLEIAKGQIKKEEEQTKKADKFLFCDTNLLVLKIWSEDLYDSCDEWIENEIVNRKYDFYLLCKNDFPWVADTLRENQDRGDYFFEKFKQLLIEKKLPFAVLSGDIQARLSQSLEILGEIN